MTERISRFDKEWATRRGVGAPNQAPGPKSRFTSAGGGADFQGRAGGIASSTDVASACSPALSRETLALEMPSSAAMCSWV
jgi:hypothetical protein